DPILRKIDEVWCPSAYVRNVYKDSGIPEERRQVVPNGVDIRVFNPDAPPYVFTMEPGAERLAEHQPRTPSPSRPFIFLYIGGTIHRKGIDILLDAYLQAFTRLDDVCLVIKDTCTETAYRGMHAREHILSHVNDPIRPHIIYLDGDLRPHELAGLYTAAD